MILFWLRWKRHLFLLLVGWFFEPFDEFFIELLVDLLDHGLSLHFTHSLHCCPVLLLYLLHIIFFQYRLAFDRVYQCLLVSGILILNSLLQ